MFRSLPRPNRSANLTTPLQERLDQLTGELSSSRLSFAKTMAILTGVLAGISSCVTIAAEGQSAVAHIVQLIGHDKETEEAAAQRLAPPPKALPAPPVKPSGPPPLQTARGAPDWNDEIPF